MPRIVPGYVLLLALTAGLVCGWFAAGALAAEPRPAIWETELGGFGHLEDAVALSDSDIWAAGDTVVHYDGADWRREPGFAGLVFHAIDGVADNALWAVGEVVTGDCEAYGFILRRGDGGWGYEAIDTHQPLFDVDMVSAMDGWAVGGLDVPVLLHYDGRAWASVGAPETAGLSAVHMLDAATGWAVGDKGTIVRYDGVHWLAEDTPTRADLMDVHMLSPTVGWAVGFGRDYGSGVILAYDNGEWTIDVDRRLPELTAVYALAPDDALAVGASGVLVRYDGDTWREIGRTYPGGYNTDGAGPGPGPADAEALPVPGAPSTLADATARRRIPARNPSAMGSRIGPGDVTYAARTVARAHPDPADPAPTGGGSTHYGNALYGLLLLPQSENLLAVGDGGQVVTIADGAWSEAHAGRAFSAIDMLSTTDGWIVGPDGPPLRWDGRHWSSVPVPRRAAYLLDVAAVAADDAWAVGESGVVVHWDGLAWSVWPRLGRDDLTLVAFTAPDDGWAVASEDYGWFEDYASIIYHYDGHSWQPAMHLCQTPITDVAAVASDDVWFASWGDRLLHFDGVGWSWVPVHGLERADGPAPAVWSVAAVSGRVWAAGDGLASWDGAAWRALPEAQDHYAGGYLYRVAAVDDDAVWAVGRYYRYDPETGAYTDTEAITVRAPGTIARVAHTETVSLTDLAVVKAPDGAVQVWAVGAASTVVRYGASAPDAALPEPTITPPRGAPVAIATPTARAVRDAEEVAGHVLSQLDPDETGAVTITRAEIVSQGDLQRRVREFWAGPFVSTGGWWEDPFDSGRCYGWQSVWLVEATGWMACSPWLDSDDPEYERDTTDMVLALDDAAGADVQRHCFASREGRIFLPFAVGGSVAATPVPTSTPIVRNLTPQPVENVDGPCPTPTP